MEMNEYKPGEVVSQSSPLYRVVHYPPKDSGEHLETFYCGQHFPPCPECGMKVRYMLPSRLLKKNICN